MKRSKRAIIFAMCIGIFLCMLDTTVMNVALPSIQSTLKVSLSSLSWALNLYTILFAALTIPLGKLAENWGMGRMYIGGIVLFLSGSFVSACANTLPLLLIGRGGQSIGAAIVFPLSMSIGISVVDLHQRHQVVSMLGITQGLAAALGPVIGGILTQFFGWRYIFLINVPLMVMALVICATQLSLKPAHTTLEIDYGGALLSMIMLGSLITGLVKGRDWGWLNGRIVMLFATALVSLILFMVLESKIKSPMIPLQLFHDRRFVGAAVTMVLSTMFMVAVTVILPTFFTKVQGKDELTAALLITPVTGMIFIWAPIAGILVERIGDRLMIGTGFILMLLAYLMFSHLDMNQLHSVIFACLILGTGFGIITGPITVLAAADFKGSLLNASQSVVGVLRQIGISLAVAIYVSGLTANISMARSNTKHYIQNQVASLPINTHQKQLIVTKASESVAKGTSASATNKNHFSAEMRHQIIERATKHAMQKLPLTIRPMVLKKVRNKVDQRLAILNRKINACISEIKIHAKTQFSHSFTKLYMNSLPFLLLSCLVGFILPKRHW